jgi:tellurite resistance-related uncharacterized protein
MCSESHRAQLDSITDSQRASERYREWAKTTLKALLKYYEITDSHKDNENTYTIWGSNFLYPQFQPKKFHKIVTKFKTIFFKIMFYKNTIVN